MREIKKNIDIKLDGLQAESYFTGVVRVGNSSSARINVPNRFIGSKFIVVFIPQNEGEIKTCQT